MRPSAPLAYHCAPDIAWVKDDGLTLLVHQGGACSWRLNGAEVAIWDLLSLAYPFQKMVRFLSVLLACTPEDARGILVATLGEWEQKGIVCAAEGIDHG